MDLALSRRMPGVALAVQVLVIAAGVGILAVRPDLVSSTASAARSRSVSIERGTSTTATMRFQVGAGRFDLTGGATALLAASSLNTDLRER